MAFDSRNKFLHLKNANSISESFTPPGGLISSQGTSNRPLVQRKIAMSGTFTLSNPVLWKTIKNLENAAVLSVIAQKFKDIVGLDG